jgi:hypothetical protein
VAAIECWRGTPDELLSPVSQLHEVLKAHDSPTQIQATVTWLDGSSINRRSLEGVQGAIGSQLPGRLQSLRVEIKSASTSSVFLVKRQIPGLSFEVRSSTPGQALGLAESVYARMMIGYVDRFGGWRGAAWIAASLTPLVLVSFASSATQVGTTPRLLLAGLGAFSTITLFLLGSRLWILDRPLDVIPGISLTLPERLKLSLSRFRQRKYVVVALLFLLQIVYNVLGSAIADLLPWT